MNLKVVVETNQNEESKRKDKFQQIAKNKKIGRNEPCYCGSGKKFKH